MKFDKYFDVYDNYSYIQKKVAKNLASYIDKKDFVKKDGISIFEIGCGTGIFTREYLQKLNNIELFLNDIFDVKPFIKDIPYKNLIINDISNIDIPKVDLVLSSSVFQWIEDLNSLFEKISKVSDNLVFSTYIEGNLIEIKEHFNISLNYLSAENIFDKLKKYFSEVTMHKESVVLNFDSPLDVLRHLKYTGVTGLQKPSIANIRTFNKKSLTYEVAYFTCRNKKEI